MFSSTYLIVVVVAMYLILYVLKDDTSKLVVGMGALLFLYKSKLSKEGIEVGVVDSVRAEGTSLGFQPELGSRKDTIIGNNTVTADGAKPGVVVKAPTVNTGPYDGLCLKTGNKDYWMKSHHF